MANAHPPTELTAAYWQQYFPPVVFVGGTKKSGKDTVCDQFVEEAGFTKIHIAQPWLELFCERHRITFAEYTANKAHWRSLVQSEALVARSRDPNVLVKALYAELRTLPRPLVVSGVRFTNECLLGASVGALVLRVEVSDAVRRRRFVASGEDLANFNDPFEAEIATMPVDLTVPGDLALSAILPTTLLLWQKSILDNSIYGNSLKETA